MNTLSRNSILHVSLAAAVAHAALAFERTTSLKLVFSVFCSFSALPQSAGVRKAEYSSPQSLAEFAEPHAVALPVCQLDLGSIRESMADDSALPLSPVVMDDLVRSCKVTCYAENYPNIAAAFNFDMNRIRGHYKKFGILHNMTCRCMSDVGSACDFTCYSDRYADVRFRCGPLNIQCASTHYLETGFDEGRDCRCQPRPIDMATTATMAFMSDGGTTSPRPPLVLLFESSRNSVNAFRYVKRLRVAGYRFKMLGVGMAWDSWGKKQKAMERELSGMDPEELVIISDARDVVPNALPNSPQIFIDTFSAIEARRGSGGDAVVFSAEEECCVASMTTTKGPGNLIAEHGERLSFAFGNSSYLGKKALKPWVSFFKEAAEKQGFMNASFPYLNAGLFAGRAKNILKMFHFSKLEDFEDDQAVFSDAMYRMPDTILLDYEQRLFGNTFWRLCEYGVDGCLMRWNESVDGTHWVSARTGSTPVFLHTPGRFWECYQKLSEKAQH